MAPESFWRTLWQLLRPYWVSEEKWLAVGLLALILGCEIGQVRLMVMLNDWNKGFFDALQAFQKELLGQYLLQFAGMVAVFVFVTGYSGYLGGLLVNRWRRWLTRYYQNKWLLEKNYYHLQVYNKHIDNPDQRISEDLVEFPTLTLTLFTSLFSSIITLVSFSIILWNISGQVKLPYIDMVIPGFIFWGALLFSVVGTWVTFIIGARLTSLSYAQEKFNADYRYRLIRIRESAEQIAFYQGEDDENKQLTYSFYHVFDNTLKIIKLKKYLTFFNTAYLNFSHLGGTLLALPRFLSEKLAIGILIQTSQAFSKVHETLSFIVFSYPTIASWRAAINRLAEFNQKMEEVAQELKTKNIHFTKDKQEYVQLANLNIQLPNGKTLLKHINLTINQGEKILLQGASGSGKSTLLRTIAGLWSYGDGLIKLPLAKRFMFCPQRPYLPIGTLKAIVTYPASENAYPDAEVSAVLQACNLAELIPELTTYRHWSQILSLGEQQRIAFARVILHKPDWLFLDEATSALDEQNELQLYQHLLEHLPDAAIISVGHRSSLYLLHQRTMLVSDQGIEVKTEDSVSVQVYAKG